MTEPVQLDLFPESLVGDPADLRRQRALATGDVISIMRAVADDLRHCAMLAAEQVHDAVDLVALLLERTDADYDITTSRVTHPVR